MMQNSELKLIEIYSWIKPLQAVTEFLGVNSAVIVWRKAALCEGFLQFLLHNGP